MRGGTSKKNLDKKDSLTAGLSHCMLTVRGGVVVLTPAGNGPC